MIRSLSTFLRHRLFSPRVSSLFLIGTLLSPCALDAWPADAYRNMVYDTLLLMPPSLGRVLRRNERHLLDGVARLDGDMASALARDGRAGVLSERTASAVAERIDSVAESVDQHRPFREIAFELGKLLRIAADLADPTIVGASNDRLMRAAGEFHRFVTLHLSEFPLVYDWSLPSTVEGASVDNLLQGLTEASREAVPRLASAFWREGELVPATEFDFRSVPYAAASLGYSRGVTAASYLWLAAWSKAKGDFTGYRFYREDRESRPKAKRGRRRP